MTSFGKVFCPFFDELSSEQQEHVVKIIAKNMMLNDPNGTDMLPIIRKIEKAIGRQYVTDKAKLGDLVLETPLTDFKLEK